MDYVLFGMGYGATLMLLGWALRTFGPNRKYKDTDPEDIDRSVLQRRWIRFIQGLGGVISIAGMAMVMFTFIVMLVNPVDETGKFIMLVIWAFLAVAVLLWCWFYISNFGSVGIWSREEGYGFRGRSNVATSLSSEPHLSTSRVVPRPRITDRSSGEDVDPIPNDAAEPDEPTVSTDPVSEMDAESPTEAELESVGEAPASTSESEALTEDEADPEYDFGDSTDTTVPSEIGGRTEAIRRLRERRARSGKSSN